AGGQRGGRHAVVAAEPFYDECVIGPFGAGDVHGSRQSSYGDRGSLADDIDGVVGAGAVDDHRVRLTVARATARRGLQVDVHLSDIGSGQVADGDGVGAAAGREIHALGAGHIHDDVGHVACEAQT